MLIACTISLNIVVEPMMASPVRDELHVNYLDIHYGLLFKQAVIFVTLTGRSILTVAVFVRVNINTFSSSNMISHREPSKSRSYREQISEKGPRGPHSTLQHQIFRLGEFLCSRRHDQINILASHSHEGLPPNIYHDWSMKRNEHENKKTNNGRPNPAICSNCATSLADTSDRASAFWSHPRWIKGGYNS